MSSPSIRAPKGTRDLAGAEAEAFTELENVARRVFGLFHFSEVRTPLFESAELFSRSLGPASDIVEKEMFTFADRGERAFALRPEGTAGVVRYFVENNLPAQGGIHRLFYSGPMFRAERPQAGRYRQFWQIGSEYFGDTSPAADADTVLMIAKILRDFGLSDFSIQVNSLGCAKCRPRHREALLAYLKQNQAKLSEESKKRMAVNPLRVLDSKEDGPKLKGAPAMKDYLCAACAAHHQTFLSLVRQSPERVEENSRLVRGLDYYSRTVFEFVSPDLGAQNAVAAGGRYDELVELLGGPPTPAVGFALGSDRVVEARGKEKSSLPPSAPGSGSAFIIPMMTEALSTAFALSQELRGAGIPVPPLLLGKKLKNQLSSAALARAKWAILIGDDEMQRQEVTVKNLDSREQVRVPRARVLSALRS